MSTRQGSQVATGVLLIALGLIFLGERQHFVPVIDLGRLWPVLLIVLGLGRVAESGWHRSGLWLVFIGALFLLSNYDIFPLRDSWPLFIVAGGLSLAFGRKCDTPKERPQP
jgi:sulfite exporter TauE/SafE